jgi:hypothetical protein
MESKSLFLDSCELKEGGLKLVTVDEKTCTQNPISGVARMLSANQRQILSHESMRVTVNDNHPGVVRISILSGGSEKEYTHTDDWDLSKFDITELPDRNFERMIGVAKSGSKLERLVNKSVTPETSVVVPQEPQPEKFRNERSEIRDSTRKIVKATVPLKTPVKESGKTELERDSSRLTPVLKKTAAPSASVAKATTSLPHEVIENPTSVLQDYEDYLKFKEFIRQKQSKSFADQTEEDEKLEKMNTRGVKSYKFFEGKSWNDLCVTSNIVGTARVELESDFADFIANRVTHKDFSSVHPEAVSLFKKAKRGKEFVALANRKGSKKLAPQFLLPLRKD